MKIRKLHPRLRNVADLRHKPSGHGKGRWHSLGTLYESKQADRKKRKAAKASRKRNR